MKKRKLFLCIIVSFALAIGLVGAAYVLPSQLGQTKEQSETAPAEETERLISDLALEDPSSTWNTAEDKIFSVSDNKKLKRSDGSVRIGVAWRSDAGSEFYVNVCKAIKEAGGTAVALGEVIDFDLKYTGKSLASECIATNNYLLEDKAELVKQNTYKNSNIEEIIKKADVDAIIFTGGKDISPTLIADSTSWSHIKGKKDYDATRDVSDYLLMAYCIDNNIPVLGICRGMQMLAIVSGSTLIQDIPAYYRRQGLTYSNEHSNIKVAGVYRDYAAHDISIATRQSIVYDMFGSYTVEKVPSWHHQAVLSVENTNLKVTATTEAAGCSLIEAIERTDKALIIGLQFHPEAAIAKTLKKALNADNYMDYNTALKAFRYLVDYAKYIYADSAA